MTYLNHVTLDTGHNRRSPRSEVGQSAIDIVTAHLARAIAAGTDPILDLPYELKATASGAFLLATIVTGGLAPVITFGVAPRSRGAAKLWSMLAADGDYPVERGQPPAAPWCAVRIDNPMAAAALGWAADYERIVAWAWIEGRSND